MAFLALTSFTCSLFVFVNQGATSIYGLTTWSSSDFYYRAIASANLRVVYYSQDHSNVLNTQILLEIHVIEQQIKSWPGYANHSIIYKEKAAAIKDIFGASPLYLAGTPTSALNYMFPESLSDLLLMTGDGDAFNEQWPIYMDALTDFDDIIWFNPNAFNISAPSTPFLISNYPFGYKSAAESRADLIEFVQSFASLLDSVSSQNIFVSYSYRLPQHDVSFPPTLSVNEQIYRYQKEGNASLCHLYVGYSKSTGVSSQAMQFVHDPFPENFTHISAVDQFDHEECRKNKWPMYLAEDNMDTIRFDNYRWNMVYDANEYYCTVLVENVSFCNGQWQSVDDGQYVDINVVINDNVGFMFVCNAVVLVLVLNFLY